MSLVTTKCTQCGADLGKTQPKAAVSLCYKLRFWVTGTTGKNYQNPKSKDYKNYFHDNVEIIINGITYFQKFGSALYVDVDSQIVDVCVSRSSANPLKIRLKIYKKEVSGEIFVKKGVWKDKLFISRIEGATILEMKYD